MIMAVRKSSSCSTPTPYEGEVRSRIYLRVPGEADMKKGGDEDLELELELELHLDLELHLTWTWTWN
ncbi:hypothetical protein JHW43_002662 [Diplocarpon mali]|nr:hypothetical protein JHW43_002662 [Diplocarpon mali]